MTNATRVTNEKKDLVANLRNRHLGLSIDPSCKCGGSGCHGMVMVGPGIPGRIHVNSVADVDRLVAMSADNIASGRAPKHGNMPTGKSVDVDPEIVAFLTSRKVL